ncbi:hypothetical protein DH2020_029013 [Rehmannia glutinosa]|uniref:Uncharacterized protein n=1 Tax=Rehmannia glutinosa TaxID=99300 RepID=A0ABR0VQN0_REHGL
MSNSKVVYEGWMVRYGRRKIGRSFIHMRYFVLESRLLAYYKKKPQDNVVPTKTLLIDGNCRVEDRGLKTHHGHMVYVLSVYNKKEKYHRITMAAFNIQEALIWKEKIESVIDQPKSCSRAMKAVGVVEATCEEIFELVMSMDATRCEWDCSFQYGSLVEEVDGHTAILYHRLQLDWFPVFVWPRDLCYVRYWRRNDDGSYGKCSWSFPCSSAVRFSILQCTSLHLCFYAVVLFRSREHENCGPQPGFVRAHIESGGFNISPMKPRNGRPRTQVQHLMQIDLKGWGVGYVSSFQQHCLLQMLNSVAGLREYFSQTDERSAAPRIPVMVNMTSVSTSSKRNQKLQSSSVHHRSASLDQIHAANRNAVLMDEYSDEDEDLQYTDQEALPSAIEVEDKRTAFEEESINQIDLSIFSGNLRHDDHDKARNCWTLSDGSNFRVRSKHFCYDKSKNFCNIFLKIPAGKHLMDLVAVDWFKDTKRMDHVARRSGCAAQSLGARLIKVPRLRGYEALSYAPCASGVPGSTHYSMVFYFVAKELVTGSLLQRFVDGDDEFRNSRLKLIPSVPKIDVDIGSSTVANGVLGLVIGVITSLVVDMAFLVQANTTEELPERLIGAVRVSHIELSSAIVPRLESDP